MNEKILVVDDEVDILQTLETLLTSEGFQVRKAFGGQHALEICQSEPIDLVITDIRMPGMDGLEVIRKLKQLDQDLEIIVLTGFATIDNAIEALHEGRAFDFLKKPLEDLDEFFNSILQALEKRRLRIQNRTLLEQLRKHRDHLEELVDQRTTDLQAANARLQQEIVERKEAEVREKALESQLRQAQKMEAIGTLAGGIAHDFNNILGTILGYTEVLSSKLPEGSPEQEYLKCVYRAGERAAELVQQILTFSRSGKGTLSPLYIPPIIKEALKMMRATIPTTITICQNIDRNCHPILANATQIHQVIVNLCTNASHAMRETGGTLDIQLQEIDSRHAQEIFPNLSEGTYLKLIVNDTGEGMREETKERIFEPFFTTKEAGEGTGLGLSVVHGIVNSHHGLITVDSESGKGTKLCILFPVVEEEAQADIQEDPLIRRGHEHILVVDDDPDLVRLYEIGLSELGYHVTTCNGSYKAWETFCASPDQFDLVFTDQTMPIMTGVQFAERLFKIRPNIPIILATGYSDCVTEEEAKAFGIRQFFMKPVKINRLAHSIRMILESHDPIPNIQ